VLSLSLRRIHNLGKVKAHRYLSKSFSLHTSGAAAAAQRAGKTMNAFTRTVFQRPLSVFKVRAIALCNTLCQLIDIL